MKREQLLIEGMTPSDGNILTEASVSGKDMYLHGVFMQAAQKNRNGRTYPLNEMVAAVALKATKSAGVFRNIKVV